MKRKIKRKCSVCGEKFILTHKSQKYCSTVCAGRANRPLVHWVIFNRDDFICQYCGRNPVDDGVKLHIDHIKPKVNGGADSYDNLVTSCERCNVQKQDKPLLHETQFKQRLKRRDFITDNQYDEKRAETA